MMEPSRISQYNLMLSYASLSVGTESGICLATLQSAWSAANG